MSTGLTPREVGVVIIGTLMAMFLAALDQTIVATALPPIAGEFGDFTLVSWVVTAYLVTSTAVTPVIGKLSDLYGRRSTLLIAGGVFMASSVFCALAPNMTTLIFARALQGLGGGALITVPMAIIGDVVSPRERGRYAGYFSSMWVAAALAGPILGGFLTEYFGWRLIFWINIPLGAAALLVVNQVLRKLPVTPRRGSIDYLGVVWLTCGTVTLLLLLSLGGKRIPWTSASSLLLAAASLVLAALFVRRQWVAREAIVPPRFMRHKVIAPVLAVGVLVPGTHLALSVLAPIYFQVALGKSVSTSGLLMIPLMVSSTMTANLAGLYSRKTARYKQPPLYGLAFAAVVMALLAWFADTLSAPAVSFAMMMAGFGIGPSYPCSTVAAQNAVERQDMGAVTGAVTFSRALGGALAIAAGSALLLGLLSGTLDQLPMEGERIASLEDLARQALPPAARAAVGQAFGVLFGVMAGMFALGLAVFTLVEDRLLSDQPTIRTVSSPD